MIALKNNIKTDRFTDGKRNYFKVINTYTLNEENDTWVSYINEKTSQEYSCRLEAFLARFDAIIS